MDTGLPLPLPPMARTPTRTVLDDGILVSWLLLDSTDTEGVAWAFNGQADIVVHVFGTFGAATLTIDGSYNNTDFNTVQQADLTLLSKTAAGIYYLLTPCDFLKPVTSGADGSTALNILIRGYKRRI